MSGAGEAAAVDGDEAPTWGAVGLKLKLPVVCPLAAGGSKLPVRQPCCITRICTAGGGRGVVTGLERVGREEGRVTSS